ncbi:MAG: RNase adapter RapZ [Pseudomonadota bacterium]
MTEAAHILLISGLSGSGKSVALNALEDQGYYCVDNLPARLLPALARQVMAEPERYHKLAVGIDARVGLDVLARLSEDIRKLPLTAKLIFLTADNDVLIRRFSETRRRHPLAGPNTLGQAISEEREALIGLERSAHRVIDTSNKNVHDLRRLIWSMVSGASEPGISSLVLESFAFKNGLPRAADLVFDARCLPNPHWQPGLREATGRDDDVVQYLENETSVRQFADDVDQFVRRWLPAWAGEQRSQLMVAIGCTGGQHRSVYLVEQLAKRWQRDGLSVIAHHRELES